MKKINLMPPFESIRTKPANLISSDEYLFKHEFRRTFKGNHYLICKNIILANESIISLFGIFFYAKYWYFYKPNIARIIKDTLKNYLRTSKSNLVIDEGIWITDNKSSVYFHWLCDAMTRYENLPDSIKDTPVLIPEKFQNDWTIEMLRFLNIPFIIFRRDEKIKVKKLFVPSYTAPSGNFNKEIITKLSLNLKNIAAELPTPDGNFNKIWISMDKHRRPVKNIEEIRPILKKHGFVELILEDLSIHEKINILRSCKVLVGSHSSGLTNMMFMSKGGKVVDIRDPRDEIKNAFFSLASEFEIKYYYMERENNFSEVVIDPEKLKNLFLAL